jgi:uncharacterized protein (DUF983 family)
MALTRCPDCGKVMIVRRNMLGDRIGCMHCGHEFPAEEYTRPVPILSVLVVAAVAGFLAWRYLL